MHSAVRLGLTLNGDLYRPLRPQDLRLLTPVRGAARLSRVGQSRNRQLAEVCRVQPPGMMKRQFKDFAVADVEGVTESTAYGSTSQNGIAGNVETSGVIGIVNSTVSESMSSSPVSTTASVVNPAAMSFTIYSASQDNAEIMDIILVAIDDAL
jgi:hypothetical protein